MEKVNYFKISPLLTDKYMISMCHMYYKTEKHEQMAVFEFFFRKNPFKGKFTVWAGLSQVLNWIKNLEFTEDDIQEIKRYLPKNENFTEWLSKADTKLVTAKSIAEGTVVFPKTPLLTLEGPLGLIGLLEVPILNMLNFPSLIATQASRLKTLAEEKKVFEFGIRRAQGPNGALMGTLYSYIGGIDGTSNVLAGKDFNVPCIGTMGHSYTTSFDSLKDIEHIDTLVNDIDLFIEASKVRAELGFSNTNDGELASFITFAVEFPDNFVALLDSWDTIKSGLRNYICVAVAMLRNGLKPKGVRMDSGNLAELSEEIRDTLAELQERLQVPISDETLIFATNSLNEKELKALPDGNSIDAFGIGTNLITCETQPALGMVCKLVELEGRPILKMSDEVAKTTLPGRKLLFRCSGLIHGKLTQFDIIGVEGELIAPDETFYINVFSIQDKYHEIQVKVKEVEIMSHIVFEDLQIKKGFDFDVEMIRSHAQSQRQQFGYLTFDKSPGYKSFISEALHTKLQKLISENDLSLKKSIIPQNPKST